MAYVPPYPINVGHIDDVQELIKNKPTAIPERFLRDTTERPASAIEFPPNALPIIDFSKLVQEKEDEYRIEMLQLAKACEEWGFFQVINHGIDLESIENVAKDFFKLPVEEKQKYSMVPGVVHGYGQAFVFSEDQKLDWCNMFALGLEPHSIRDPKLWPTNPPKFSEAVEVYSSDVRKLCQNLIKHIALTLGLRANVFEEMFGETVQAIRMNYYPPCSRPDLVFGLSPHSDGSALTVLMQGKGSPPGLQIHKDDEWITVEPIPDSLIINIGDTLEVLTNGKYKSMEHRAITHKERERLSIATFYAPNYDVELGPMPEFVDEENPSKFRRYSHGEYSIKYLSNKLQGGKKNLEFAQIQSSLQPTIEGSV